MDIGKNKKGIEWTLFGMGLTIVSITMFFILNNNVLAGWILSVICYGYFLLMIREKKHPIINTLLSLVALIFICIIAYMFVYVSNNSVQFITIFQFLCMFTPVLNIVSKLLDIFLSNSV